GPAAQRLDGPGDGPLRPHAGRARRLRSAQRSEKVAELRPALVRLADGAGAALDVQVDAARRAEARAVVAAEDLERQRQHQRVLAPAVRVEDVAVQVRRGHLVLGARLGLVRLVLAALAVDPDAGLLQAALARPEDRRLEVQVEEEPGREPGDPQGGGNAGRYGLGPLSADGERRERELDRLEVRVPDRKANRPKVEPALSLAPTPAPDQL